jgi:regulatory protein
MAGRRSSRAGASRQPRLCGGVAAGDKGQASGNGARDPHEHARQTCLRLLAARPRTRAELAAALRREGIDDQTAQAVLGRLADVGLVDDESFAESFVHSGHAYQGLGRRALAAQLRRRGVDEATTSTALSGLDTVAEERRARELVRRRLPAMVTTDETTVIRRLVGLLARKGYSPGLSYRVLREELREAGRDASQLDEPVLADDESYPEP